MGVDALFGEGFGEQPRYYGQVAALIVGGQEDGVLVFRRHVCLIGIE